MKLFIEAKRCQYEINCLCRMFFPGNKLDIREAFEETGDDYILARLAGGPGRIGPEPRHIPAADAGVPPECPAKDLDGGILRAPHIPPDGDLPLEAGSGSAAAQVEVRIHGKTYAAEQAVTGVNPDEEAFHAECERVFGVLLYRILSEITQVFPKWGILTGVRPVKLVYKYRRLGCSDAQISAILTEQYLVSPEKVRLLFDTASHEYPVIQRSRPDDYSLYISIPFCPSRCLYCSFVSHSVEKAGKLMDEYLRLLCEEIKYTGELVSRIGLHLKTVYIGGGTPTTLRAEQLKTLTGALHAAFPVSSADEFTVEAGRPDTIDREKLQVLLEAGVTRISINPQTLNDHVLEAIGRRHTAREALDSFQLAKEVGHRNINMDLIAGLSEDTLESFRDTVDRVVGLQPENITLHALTVKRAATLATDAAAVFEKRSDLNAQMLSYAYQAFRDGGYHPYYMYRQKGTVDNLENVGFCKPGFEGLYNIYIMDETHSILALGAGAVSKLRQPQGEGIERFFNFKFPYEYISRFDEILARKEKILEFYARFGYEFR
ncbi:coproporphyrinogen dehydrogenase HemZ [Candidatus Soleaferrea massiliensis]|uniref:coproporphyrinogen dehydrogenase HemZ n=1 Tax=Candidatus Soleaferrea massiliensis TaxID=1470354 RepID=UPI00059087E7|nr:coproporphyrinogen dehydrogenase HemZ [Candidatus Soleaferrea massiliensis]